MRWVKHRNIGGESDIHFGLRKVLGYGEGEKFCLDGQDEGIFTVTNMNAISANMCIATLNAGSPCYRAGNIVVVGVDYPHKTVFLKHRDISLSDFRLAMELFSLNNKIFEGQAPIRTESAISHGSKVLSSVISVIRNYYARRNTERLSCIQCTESSTKATRTSLLLPAKWIFLFLSRNNIQCELKLPASKGWNVIRT
jgi:hypothetical protein